MAYKFSPRDATTVVEDIVVQVGRTGALTPVAVMRPVNVGGITITHATLHNADEIERLGLKIGDTVIVSRAGDVIPQITKVLTEFRNGKEIGVSYADTCPVDGSKFVQRRRDQPLFVAHLRREHREFLYHFVSRGAFNIEGLGPKILDKFLDEGLISDAADIFTLGERGYRGTRALRRKIGGKYRDRSGREEKSDACEISLRAWHFACRRRNSYHALAEFRVSPFDNVANSNNEILKIFEKLSLGDLQRAPDVGPKVAQSIYDWFREPRNVKFVERLAKSGVEIEAEAREANGALSGKTFVLTGGLLSMSRGGGKGKNQRARR